MDDRIATILAGISRDDIDRVASGALGVDVNVTGDLDYSEVTRPHAEARTVAIVRVSGSASGRVWSSVVKILDMSVEINPRLVGSTAPETEEIVYEEAYFTGRPSGLRPARCYLISRPTPYLKLLWLEDLTEAAASPFNLTQLREMSRQFGDWNGEHVAQTPELRFPLLRDTFIAHYRTWDFPSRVGQLAAMADAPAVRAMYRSTPVAIAYELVAVMQPLLERGATMRGTLAYGDCSAGNLFFVDGRTVGIDWASLTLEPLGVDAGCLIGSSMTWGPDFATVAQRERELFDCYLEGLAPSGWDGDPDDVRIGYFCQFGFYLSASLMLPINLSGTDRFLAASFFERRYGLPIDEIPARAAPLVDLAPAFIAEIGKLVG